VPAPRRPPWRWPTSCSAAQERWRRFNGHELVAEVLDGATFKDGIEVEDTNYEKETEKVAA
jgi:hypothetical protein